MKEMIKVIPNHQLKRERELRFWSQQQVAAQIDTTALNVSRWERGITSPNLHFRHELCDLYGKSVQELGLVQEDVAEGNEQLAVRLLSDANFLFPVSDTFLYDSAIPLPSLVSNSLIGRDEFLNQLKQQLSSSSAIALSGLPGVGKSALAIELAHDREMLQCFSDGVLWVGVGRNPNKSEQFSRWSKLLEISFPEASKRLSPSAWAGVIHAAIGVRRMLLIIDDVWSIEDALSFKVGGPNCVHLLTTRFPEVALNFAGSDAMVVRELDEEESEALLTCMAPDVVTSEPDEVRMLVQSVGGLPLALTLMGKYLQTQAYSGQPRRIHAALARLQLAEERLQLTKPLSPVECSPSLPTGTPLSLQAAIDVSNQQLDEQAQHTLRALSFFPAKPNSFSEEGAMIICDVPAKVFDALTDAGLLEGSGPGRYMLHQTIADYASLGYTDEIVERRLVAYYFAYLEAHKDHYDILELEMNNVLTAIDIACHREISSQMVGCVNTFAAFLESKGFYAIAESQLNKIRQAASSLGDDPNLALTLVHLGRLSERQEDCDQAESDSRS